MVSVGVSAVATVSAACSSVFGGSEELFEALAMELSALSVEVAPSASGSDCVAAASSANHLLCRGVIDDTRIARRDVRFVRELMVLHLVCIDVDVEEEERTRNATLRRQYLWMVYQ